MKPLETVSSFTLSACFLYSISTGPNPRLFKATKELIVSGGTISTPHILFHSGIGDPKLLKSVGITPVFDMPSLGKNLSDHPRLQIDFAANNTEPKCVLASIYHLSMIHRISIPSVLADSTLFEKALGQWNDSRTGPLSNTVINNLIWGRVPSNLISEDATAGPNSPHWEIIPAVNLGPTPAEHVFVFMGVVSPASRE